MILKPLSPEDMETVRIWREQVGETLRTPYMLTKEMQEEYYYEVICNRESHTRYWGLWIEVSLKEFQKYHPEIHYSPIIDRIPAKERMFIGYGGIENIEWENRRGEISLLIGPDYRRKGYGKEAVWLFLDQAFNYLNLHTVYGEVYHCSDAFEFWKRMIWDFKGSGQTMHDRKYWNNAYWMSTYFTFYKDRFNEIKDKEKAGTE